MQRAVATLRAFCAGVFLFSISQSHALAIPVFANGQGVSCESCHTTFPGMTRYGMMVMMSNFQLLNRHLQDKALPLAVRLYIDTHLGNKQSPGSTHVSDLSLLGGGFLGNNFTWYAEQHVIDSGAIGQTEQVWLSWNGLFHGLNSLQAGKFHTPFPFMPAHAWSLSDYLLATQTTGQNAFNPNDARWGLAFNGMSNEFMYNFSYLTGSGSTSDALDFNRATHARALDANVSYGGMAIPWSVGLVAIRGFAPLHAGIGNAFAGSDPFTREGVYYGYQTAHWHFQSMYYHGFDAHPDTAEYDVPLNGYFFEAERDLGWRNHVLLRYDAASSDTLNRQYVLDLAHNVQPNLALIGEVSVGPDQRPQIGLRIAFAGPYQYGQRYLWKGPVGAKVVSAAQNTPGMPAQNAAVTAGTVGAMGDPNAGAKLVAQNGCQGCHGAQFQGGIGPKLFGIEHRLQVAQIAGFIDRPVPPMPNFGFTPAQVRDVAAYLSALDGGESGAQPVVSFSPSPPALTSTMTVRFAGAVPQQAQAVGVMQMGGMKMPEVPIDLKPTGDPHIWSGTAKFSMGGPWTIELRYGRKQMDIPITVNG